MEIIFAIVFLIFLLASFWFWIRTLIIMARENIFWAVGGFFIAPLIQIIFYLTQKDNINLNDKPAFHIFFAMQVFAIIIGLLAGVMGASLLGAAV